MIEKGGVCGLEARGGGAGAEYRPRDRRTAAVLTKLAAGAAAPYAPLRPPLSNVLEAGSSRRVGLSGFDTRCSLLDKLHKRVPEPCRLPWGGAAAPLPYCRPASCTPWPDQAVRRRLPSSSAQGRSRESACFPVQASQAPAGGGDRCQSLLAIPVSLEETLGTAGGRTSRQPVSFLVFEQPAPARRCPRLPRASKGCWMRLNSKTVAAQPWSSKAAFLLLQT